MDRLSILEIKCNLLVDPVKLEWVNSERRLLEARLVPIVGTIRRLTEYHELLVVNCKLWTTENEIRALDSAVFEESSACNYLDKEEFIRLARIVYTYNDMRANLKHSVDRRFESAFREAKSYVER